MTTPRFNYTGHAWEGASYDRDLGIKEIANLVRQHLKKTFPRCKFSVTIERYSMGQSMNIHLMTAPFPAIIKKGSFIYGDFKSMEDQGFEFEQYSQLNEYQFKDSYEDCYPIPGWNNGAQLTEEAWEVLKAVTQFAKGYNFDDSDSMVDYFHTNFHLHMEVGKWNKPFEVRS